MSLDNLNEEKPQIKINRKMRMWNKYRYICYALAAVVVCVIVIFAVKGISSSPKKGNDNPSVVADNSQSTQAVKPAETNSSSETKGETQTSSETPSATQSAGVAKKGQVYTVTASLEADIEFTEEAALSGSVFVGDSVANGISGYGFFDATVADNNMSTDKADNYVDDIMAYNPKNVIVLLGLNDANYVGRTTDAIVGYLTEFVTAIHERDSSVSVYIVSVLPVTESFEGTCDVRQSTINDINSACKDNIESIGANYIDIADCYKDGSGFLMEDCTNNGSNIRKPYYGFLLNEIAGALK